MFIIMK